MLICSLQSARPAYCFGTIEKVALQDQGLISMIQFMKNLKRLHKYAENLKVSNPLGPNAHLGAIVSK